MRMLINNDTIIKDDNKLIRQKSNDVSMPSIRAYILISGMVVSNNISLINLFIMALCLCSVIGCQFVNQVSISSKFKTCSPFEVLFCTYFSYFIVSTFFLIAINLAFFNYSFVFPSFGWFMFLDVDLLMWSLIGFGIGGAFYAMLSVFGSISLAKKDIINDFRNEYNNFYQ